MATYGSRTRSGLPRVPGGPAWPPAVVRVTAAESSLVPELPADPTAAVSTVSVLPESGSSRVVRRGLPRVAGGEPWPPQSAEPQPAPVPALPHRSETAPESGDRLVLRRGLPRVTGGEPWPPAGAFGPLTATTAHEAREQPSVPARDPVISESLSAVAKHAVADAEPAPTPAMSAQDTVLVQPEPAKRYGPFTLRQWVGGGILALIAVVIVLAALVFAVRWFLSLTFMRDFVQTYPGAYPLPASAPVGLPAWVGWQHFCNIFFMVLIIRSGIEVRRQKRPKAFWSPRWNSKRKISLSLWFHQSLDIFWVLNGVIFIVLLFATGQWMRIVPTSWDVFPNAITAGLRYGSLSWPTDDSWANYNSLQQLTYFFTVFIAAPVAAITGIRMSGLWPKKAERLSALYPIELARKIHFPTMCYFVTFIVIHVTLVFATGALRNLNHMFAARDDVSWTGFWIFAAAMATIVAGWVAARPVILVPIARLFGTVRAR